MKANNTAPNYRQNPSVGKFQGFGIPTKYGEKKGTFTNSPTPGKLPKGTPPTKF